ncbi:MAG: hypothetical protein IJX46_04200, partial [Clostridia bacterium]|nr:hypothetical protein [Clostridia bacterium]
PPLGEVARLAVPERAFLPSQSLRASSPKGRAIVLTASEVGFGETCLNHSNSDLSATSPSGDRVRLKVTPPDPCPPGRPARFIGLSKYNKIENRNDFLPQLFIIHYSLAKRLHYSLKKGSPNRDPNQ